MSRDAHGRFLPGPDRQRHPLTAEEKSRGGRHAWARQCNEHGDYVGAAWLWRRVRGWYRVRRRRN